MNTNEMRDRMWEMGQRLDRLIAISEQRELTESEKIQMRYVQYFLSGYQAPSAQNTMAAKERKRLMILGQPGPGIVEIASRMQRDKAAALPVALQPPPGFPAYWEPRPLNYDPRAHLNENSLAAAVPARRSERKTKGKRRNRGSRSTRSRSR